MVLGRGVDRKVRNRVATEFGEEGLAEKERAEMRAIKERLAMPPDAIARAVEYAIEQPPEVDVNEIVIRPTAQS